MIGSHSLLNVYASLFSPLARRCPAVMLDETLTVREADDAACAAGLEAGMCLSSLLCEQERSLHEACLRRASETRFAPLGTPENSALFSLAGLPGFTLLYLEYAYTPRHALIRGVLFSDRREYLFAIVPAERGSAPCLAHLRKTLPSRRCDLHALLRAEEAEEDAAGIEAGVAAALTAVRCLHNAGAPGAGDLFSLTHLLEIYRTDVLDTLYFIDCTVHVSTLPEDAMYIRQEPDEFLLLLSAILSVLNALSEDRCITVLPLSCGTDHELRLTTRCPALARILRRSADLQALLPAAPQKQFALTLSEYLAGACGCEPRITGDGESGMLTLSLFIPAERRSREFKAPGGEEFRLRKAAAAARAFWLSADT